MISPDDMLWAMANMFPEHTNHPNFAIAFTIPGMLNPYRRPVHYNAWPAPIYHNDNHF